ncbi:MAG: aldehyde dehydrogenase family protein, partial [Candidatus Eremiobacteraeota bacterium]|nr:aldehyde dehydrogenase family protein [Candidatus Eremiobacteraeota bacterium]
MRLTVHDKATGEELGNVPIAQRHDCATIVERAAAAFADWSRVPVVERARLLFRYAD